MMESIRTARTIRPPPQPSPGVPGEGARGDAAALYAGILALFAAAAATTAYYCWSMSGGMAMPGGWTMSMTWMRMPGQTWPQAAAMFMLMWLCMMIAMMLPSAMPMFLRDYRARQSAGPRGALAGTFLAMGGYFLVWGALGALIYPAGIALASAAMRSTPLAEVAPFIIGLVVFLAGCMQFMPWTLRGLRRCCGPTSCGQSQSNGEPAPPWRTGLACGMACVAGCSGPTLVLVALGMMNPLVIVIVSATIALEKLLPQPQRVVRLAGIAALIAGAILMATSAWPHLRG